MSDEWRVGDLALGIAPNHPLNPQYRKGGFYTVSEVVDCRGCVGLRFRDLPLADGDHSWDVSAFRRIPPHIPDEEDRETIRLLNQTPVKAFVYPPFLFRFMDW